MGSMIISAAAITLLMCHNGFAFAPVTTISSSRSRKQSSLFMTGDFAVKPPSDKEDETSTAQEIVDTESFLNSLKFERKSSSSDENADAFFREILNVPFLITQMFFKTKNEFFKISPC